MTEVIKEAPGLGRGGRMSRQRKRTAVLRLLRGEARAGGQRLCRAVHPHAQGEPALGARLRYDREASPGIAGVPAAL